MKHLPKSSQAFFVLGCLFLAACSAEDEDPPLSPSSSSGAHRQALDQQLWQEKADLLKQALAEIPVDASAELRKNLQDQLVEARAHLAAPPQDSAEIEGSQHALTDGDGCSVPGWADVALALLFQHWGATFASSCQFHDRCYTSGLATYGMSRLNCDDAWHDKMRARCDSLYPSWARWIPSILTLWVNCRGAAATMYQAVRSFGESYFWGTVCADGQTWPRSGEGPGCNSYESFDSSRQPVCTGLYSGLHDDGHIGSSWYGCRGSGCLGCTEILAAYPRYFSNHPSCTPNPTCNSVHYVCGAACPEPKAADL